MRYHRQFLLGLLAAALALGGGAEPARAASGFAASDWQGYSQLASLARERLGAERVRVVDTLDYAKLTPADGVLVVAPAVTLDFAALSTFLLAGGRVAIADDFGPSDALLHRFRVKRVSAPARPLRRVNDRATLPVAIAAGALEERHPMVRGVEQVFTNRPSAIEAQGGIELTALLVVEAEHGASATLAATGVIGDPRACGLLGPALGPACGRLVPIADASVLVNRMLVLGDNRLFADQLVDYLVEHDAWGQRGGLLYLLQGDFSEAGLPPLGAHALSQGVERLERHLSEFWSHQRFPDAAALGLTLAILLSACLGFAVYLGRPYQRHRPLFTQAQPRAAGDVVIRGREAPLVRELGRCLDVVAAWQGASSGAATPDGSGAGPSPTDPSLQWWRSRLQREEGRHAGSTRLSDRELSRLRADVEKWQQQVDSLHGSATRRL